MARNVSSQEYEVILRQYMNIDDDVTEDGTPVVTPMKPTETLTQVDHVRGGADPYTSNPPFHQYEKDMSGQLGLSGMVPLEPTMVYTMSTPSFPPVPLHSSPHGHFITLHPSPHGHPMAIHPSPNAHLVSLPVIPSAPPPTTLSAPPPKAPTVPPPSTTRRRKPARELITPDAPTQHRTYVTPSSTSRKDAPTSAAPKKTASKARSSLGRGKRTRTDAGLDAADSTSNYSPSASSSKLSKDDGDDSEADTRKGTPKEEVKRRRNTVSARRSRIRSRIHLEGLEDLKVELTAEVERLQNQAAWAADKMRMLEEEVQLLRQTLTVHGIPWSSSS